MSKHTNHVKSSSESIEDIAKRTGHIINIQNIIDRSATEPGNDNPILYWNHVALELNKLTHSEPLKGGQSGPPLSARALGIVHIAIHDAYFSIVPKHDTFFPKYEGLKQLSSTVQCLPQLHHSADDAKYAVTGAAVATLRKLYTIPSPDVAVATTTFFGSVIAQFLQNFERLNQIPNRPLINPSYDFGRRVGEVVFKYLTHSPERQANDYQPQKNVRYKFDDEPTHPIRIEPLDPNQPEGPVKVSRPRHQPYYGVEARLIATQCDHKLADPPGLYSAKNQEHEYQDALRDVHRMGGAITLTSTKRSPAQTATGIFWAYDGANLIGTPPRLYNQILRTIAIKYKTSDDLKSEVNSADFARLFALANAAMADAGILAWREKYHFEFWRPLSGVRSEGTETCQKPFDPFWLTLGAPATNSHETSFKPPFPAYPSGHATFGTACFQVARRFYHGRCGNWENREPDNISFDFVSDELDGISRDLYQRYDPTVPLEDQSGNVRTRITRHFESLWEAIFDNAISRVFLGVHWRFDACSAQDILISTNNEKGSSYDIDSVGATVYKHVDKIRYEATGTREGADGVFPVGGIGLGLEIADDIWDSGLKPSMLNNNAALASLDTSTTGQRALQGQVLPN